MAPSESVTSIVILYHCLKREKEEKKGKQISKYYFTGGNLRQNVLCLLIS